MSPTGHGRGCHEEEPELQTMLVRIYQHFRIFAIDVKAAGYGPTFKDQGLVPLTKVAVACLNILSIS